MIRKSTPVFNQHKSNIDSAIGVIKDIVIIQKGLDKSFDNIDEVFLDQVVSQGQSQLQGVKCRFGHPNMCDDALGTYVGRYKNFSTDGDNVMADLYLDQVAKNSPKGNLFDYVLNMAEKNNDMFGNSIVFSADDDEVKEVEENGEKVEKYFIRLKSLVASDLVDSPAATTSLFKSTDDFAAKATEFLDSTPELFDMLSKKPEVLTEFLTKYSTYKSMKEKSTDNDGFKSLADKISKGFNSIMDKLAGKEVAKSFDTTAADGTVLTFDDPDGNGEPAVGDNVSIAGAPAPDGEYLMPDGKKIVCVNGSVTEIIMEENKETPPAADPKDAEIKSLKATIADYEEKFKSQTEYIESIDKKLDELTTQVNSNVKSTYKPEKRATNFQKTEKVNADDPFKAAAERRKSEAEAKKAKK